MASGAFDLGLAAGTANAAPCLPAMLTAYLGLGAAGCEIGELQFSGFAVQPPNGGATPIAGEH